MPTTGSYSANRKRIGWVILQKELPSLGDLGKILPLRKGVEYFLLLKPNRNDRIEIQPW